MKNNEKSGMTSDQKSYLNQRLYSIRASKPKQYEEVKAAKPAKVREAERSIARAKRVIDAHLATLKRARETRNKKIEEFADRCKRAILFGDVRGAMAELDRFEAARF